MLMMLENTSNTTDNFDNISEAKPISIFTTRFRSLMDGEISGSKITQGELAEYIGTSRQAVSQYYTGASIPSYDTLIKIADYLGVTTDYLIGKTNYTLPRANIANDIGLSDKAVSTIKKMSPEQKRIVERIICNPNFIRLLLSIQKNSHLVQAQVNHIHTNRSQLYYSKKNATDLSDSDFYNELIKQYPFLEDRLFIATGIDAVTHHRCEINELFTKIIDDITDWTELQRYQQHYEMELRRTQRELERNK